jgi:hypothetical protein
LFAETTNRIIQPETHIWPQKADTGAWWEEEEGQDYIQQHFSIKLIAKYFRTRSPVSAAANDGWRARELMAPLFMGDDEELQAIIRDHLIFTPPTYKNMQVAFYLRSRNLQKTVGVSAL